MYLQVHFRRTDLTQQTKRFLNLQNIYDVHFSALA